MDKNILPNQFISGDPHVSSNIQYLQWIESVKSRYRQSQIKAHLQVNAAVLEFNWYLGHDISEILQTRIWGSGALNQICLDLKSAFPEAQGFSRANLYRMGRFYSFYDGQKEIVAQVVRQLQPAESKDDTNVAQVVRQIAQSPSITAGSDPSMPFPAFLGMIPWGHHIEIFESCKDVKEAVFYVERTIQNNWSRAMLSHAIAAGFYNDAEKPLNNFALTLPNTQGDLAAEMMKSELNLGFLRLKEGYTEADLEFALVNNIRRFLLEMGKDFLLKGAADRVHRGWRERQNRPAALQPGTDVLLCHRAKSEALPVGVDRAAEPLRHSRRQAHQAPARQPHDRITDMPEGQPREGGMDARGIQQTYGRFYLHRQLDAHGGRTPRCPASGDRCL